RKRIRETRGATKGGLLFGQRIHLIIPSVLIFPPGADAPVTQNILKCDLIAGKHETGRSTPEALGEETSQSRGICFDVSARAPELAKINVRKGVTGQFLVRCSHHGLHEIGSEIQSTIGICTL